MRISVFGGSHPENGSDAYLQAYELGNLLENAGHDVMTGGYIGTMEAVSRGTSEAGGHVIGVTCTEIETWRPIRMNPWGKEGRHFTNLLERLGYLIKTCDAALPLPGGPGTLTEIALTWNQIVIHAIPPKPMILIGKEWRSGFISLYNSLEAHIPEHQRLLIQFAPDNRKALDRLKDPKIHDHS